MRGQAEIIAILAIVIVAVVAVILAFQSGSLPIPISQEQQAVRNSIENLIRSGAYDSIATLSRYGGYSEPQAGTVLFNGIEVPSWKPSGSVQVPDVRANFVRSLEDYLNGNKDSFVSGLGDISVGRPSVSANFLNDKILLQVNLPSTLNGDPVPPRYDIQIPTNFGEVVDFSSHFAHEQSRSNFLETYILASMRFAPIEDGQPSTPVLVQLFRCGDFVYKGFSDISPAMEERVKAAFSTIYLKGREPVERTVPYGLFELPLNARPYENIEVSFFLPDDFHFSPSSLQFTPNPITATANPMPFTGICMSDPVPVRYYLNFPAIVRVKDPMTENVFQFSYPVRISDNAPGSSSAEEDVQSLVCSSPSCEINLAVKTVQGQPLEGADVSYLGCSIGRTNQDGELHGLVPCGSGSFELYKSGFSQYREILSSAELSSKTAIVPRLISPTVFLYQASIVNNTFAHTYEVNHIQPVEGKVILSFRSTEDSSFIQTWIIDGSQDSIRLPAGQYLVTATVLTDDLATAYGSFTAVKVLLEDTTQLHLYIPYNIEFGQLQDQSSFSISSIIYSSLLRHCDLGPISDTQIERDLPCIKQYDEV